MVDRGEGPLDPGGSAKGLGGAGRRIELVGGFGRKRTSRGTGTVLRGSAFSSRPSHKVCSSPGTPQTLCVFCRIRLTKSGQNWVSWEKGSRPQVSGRGLRVDKSRPQGTCEEEPADRGIQR